MNKVDRHSRTRFQFPSHSWAAHSWAALSWAILLLACGGGGGSSSSNPVTPPSGETTTTFPGGTLADLQALNSSLLFDRLEITGPLILPASTDTTIAVNALTITQSGSIGYTYSECTYSSAPGITINATGDVVIAGEINLVGRSGTRVTSGAYCKSCYGQNGGSISIAAANLTASGQFMSSGGAGGQVAYGWGCSGGSSGTISLTASGNLDLSGAAINGTRGVGGWSSGGSGADGASGPMLLSAQGLFTMKNGTLNTSGELHIIAGQSSITGTPMTYGTLDDSIGGAPDTVPPSLAVLSPLPNASLSMSVPLQIQVQAADAGMGLKSIRINGLGYDQVHGASEIVDGLLTVTITPLPPSTLSITAQDNKGNETTMAVPGLTLH